MRKLTDVLGLVLVAIVLLLVPSSQVAAASAPGVHAVSMGVDPQGGGAVLVVNGTGLSKVFDASIRTSDSGGAAEAELSVVFAGKETLVLRFDDPVPTGSLFLVLEMGKPGKSTTIAKPLTFPVGGGGGGGGGIVSAYDDLVSQGKIGTGAAQVAGGSHDHASAYAPLSHDHTGTWAAVDHDHGSDYAFADHTHDEISELQSSLAAHGHSFDDISGGDLVTDTTSSNLAVFKASGTNKARIDNAGTGYFNNGTQSSGADFAESVRVDRPAALLEPGDVIVIDREAVRGFALSGEAESTLVAGVYSTDPAVLAGVRDPAGGVGLRPDEIPLGVVGIVPTKVCDEGGPIRSGDLLVTSSIPGHAMKAPANVRPGTILGKALGRLSTGAGVMEVLLSLQ